MAGPPKMTLNPKRERERGRADGDNWRRWISPLPLPATTSRSSFPTSSWREGGREFLPFWWLSLLLLAHKEGKEEGGGGEMPRGKTVILSSHSNSSLSALSSLREEGRRGSNFVIYQAISSGGRARKGGRGLPPPPPSSNRRLFAGSPWSRAGWKKKNQKKRGEKEETSVRAIYLVWPQAAISSLEFLRPLEKELEPRPLWPSKARG